MTLVNTDRGEKRGLKKRVKGEGEVCDSDHWACDGISTKTHSSPLSSSQWVHIKGRGRERERERETLSKLRGKWVSVSAYLNKYHLSAASEIAIKCTLVN